MCVREGRDHVCNGSWSQRSDLQTTQEAKNVVDLAIFHCPRLRHVMLSRRHQIPTGIFNLKSWTRIYVVSSFYNKRFSFLLHVYALGILTSRHFSLVCELFLSYAGSSMLLVNLQNVSKYVLLSSIYLWTDHVKKRKYVVYASATPIVNVSCVCVCISSRCLPIFIVICDGSRDTNP